MHLEELQNTDVRCAKNETILWKYHTERFSLWIKEKVLLIFFVLIILYVYVLICICSDMFPFQIPNNSKDHSRRLRWLAFGPRNIAHTYKGFVVNGYRYHTDDMQRKTQNNGVAYEAFSICRASAKDSRQQADLVTYYGVIKEIILLDYHMFQVPLFKCSWAHKGRGLKEEDGFTLVNLHMNQSTFANDPYIMPSQAKQVFYSREEDSSPWYVVMRAPPRGYHELETEKEICSATLAVQPEEDMGDQSSDDESLCVRNDCEGQLIYE